MLSNRLELRRRGVDFEQSPLGLNVLGSGIDSQERNFLGISIADLDFDDAAWLEQPCDTTAFTHIAAALGEGIAHLRGGAITVVGRDLDEHSRAARTIAFVHRLFEGVAFPLAGS